MYDTKYNNIIHIKHHNINIWNIVWLIKIDTKWINAFGKMVSIDLFDAGLPHLQFLKYTISAKWNKVKCNKWGLPVYTVLEDCWKF